MKNVVFLIVLSLLTLNSVRAQTQSRANSNDSQSGAVNDTITIRSRVVGSEKVANYVQRRPITAAGSSELTVAWGNSSVSNSLLQNQMATSGKDGSQLVQQTSTAVEVQGNTLLARLSSDPIYPDLSVYRVGVGDVLDIRLLDLPSRESTLFTVLKGSLIEYPLVSEPLSVAGLTAEQIAVALAAKIKVIRSPRIIVTVRDYASHAVMITGLVDNPGRKILRREALPLYALLAEALPRPDAFSVTVTRAGGKIDTVKMSDSTGMSSLVSSGDAIKVNGKPANANHFLYVGGVIASPGEKEFREGITLTQLLLAAGGATSANNIVTVARLNSDGFLTSIEYDLRLIHRGSAPDPVLEPGDRVEVKPAAQ